jgi:RNA polymerase sigma-70 factor (ECF subfamily)
MPVLDPQPAPRSATGIPDSAEGGDDGLVAAIVAGDEAAFLRLAEQWSPSLAAVAVMVTGHRETTDALFSGTWRRSLEAMRAFRDPPGLRVLVMRALLDEARATGVLVAPAAAFNRLGIGPTVEPERFLDADDPQWPGHWARPPEPWPDAATPVRVDIDAALVMSLASLPEPQRLVVALRDRAGCRVEEISGIVAVSPGQVRSLLHRARATLREALEERLGEAS